MTKRKSFILTFCMALVMCLYLGFSFSSGTMTVHASSGTPVTELTISGLTDADVPQIGKNATLPDLTVNTGLELNHGYGVYWFPLNTRKLMTDTDTFESGFTYALRVQYSVLDGYDAQITDPTKIKLDGITTPYRVEIDTNAYINFVFDALGNEELSLVNPERLQLQDGYVGAFATTDAIHVKGGKYPYQFSNIQCPEWLPYAVLLDNGNTCEISFYGYRPTTPTPAQVLSFTVTDADGNIKTFTGTTGETKENPDGIANIVVNYNLPNVGTTSPTNDQIKSAITLPPNVVCTDARIYKTNEYTSTDPFTFERWEKYTLLLNLETTNGKKFAGGSLLNGYLVSDNNFSYKASFGNVRETSLVLDFNITKYGVSLAEQDNYKMTTVNLKKAKVGVPYNEKIEFVKPTDVVDSDIEIELVGDLYGDLYVNADGTITGTPDERVYYNWGSTTTIEVRYVCKGYILDYKEYQLVVEGYTQLFTPEGKTLKYNGNEQIGVEEGEGYTLTGVYKTTDLGTYKATAKLNPGYAWGYGGTYDFPDREITWEIVKGDRPAPTGIATEQATVEGKSDGKILGVSTDMGYYDYSNNSHKDCTGGTIENLPAGRYGIYYKENANYNSSERNIVEITNRYQKSDFKITTASLPNGKCGVDYNAKIQVNCPTGDLSKVEIKNYNETVYKVWGLNLAQDGTISGKPDERYGDGQQNVEWKIKYYYDDILMEVKSFFLDIDGYSVIALFQGKQNLIYNTSEQVGVEEGEGYTLSGVTKATDAGSYVATATLKPGYRWDTTNTAIQFANHPVNWSIAKANKDAPIGIQGVNTSSVGVNDGKITGVTTDMEYRAFGGTFADCTGTEIAGLAKGQYEVRYKETKNYNASASATITIAENETTTYNIKVNNGTGSGQYVEGASVTISANTPTAGKRFVGWTIEGISGLDTTQTSITFNMPANAVTATANYEIITYNVNVEKGKATPNKTSQGEKVTITANEPEQGYKFDKWITESAGVSFQIATSQETTFTMPNHDVKVTATYVKATYNISVFDCVATKDGVTVGLAYYGDVITVTANTAPMGKVFDKWVVTGLDTNGMDLTNPEITFNMPAESVTIKATYINEKYSIAVTGGSANVSEAEYGDTITINATIPVGKKFVEWTSTSALIYANKTSVTTTFTMPAGDVTVVAELYRVDVTNGTTTYNMATYQTEVTVKANEPDTDMYFDKWEVTGLETTGMDLTKTEIKFNMPAGNVTFKATYLSVAKYDITMVDGTKDISPAKAGETITITAKGAPTGKVFDKWTCETAGVTIEFASATSSTTTFVMPACEITIQAHFRDVGDAPSVEIKVKGGTGAGVVKQGDTVTIIANAPAEGKRFKHWENASGEILSTKATYEFSVRENITLTAVYEDIETNPTPDKAKQGLSGGQIAGIVIGSVLLAGIGGFAIYWFAISKKTFADLGTAFKKFFEKIKNLFKKKK